MAYKILVVDDDPITRTATTRIIKFKYDDSEVMVSMHGKEALDLILKQQKEGGFDFILTDYEMPEMNGFELIKQVRELHPEQGERMALYTGNIYKFNDEHPDYQGHVLTKPYESKDLYTVIDQYLK